MATGVVLPDKRIRPSSGAAGFPRHGTYGAQEPGNVNPTRVGSGRRTLVPAPTGSELAFPCQLLSHGRRYYRERCPNHPRKSGTHHLSIPLLEIEPSESFT